MAKTKPFDEHFEDYEKWFDFNKYTYQSEIKALVYFIPKKRRIPGNRIRIDALW